MFRHVYSRGFRAAVGRRTAAVLLGWAGCLAALLLFQAAGCGGAGAALHIQPVALPAGVEVPLEVEAAHLAREAAQVAVAGPGGGGAPVVFQRTPAIFHAAPGRREEAYCAVLPADAAPGTYASVDLEAAPRFSFSDEAGRLTLYEGIQPVLAYNYGMQLAPGVPEAYRRTAYVHPIWDLRGTVLTDDFPEEHYHHRGMSWMWPRVFVGGAEYDLWALQGVRPVFEAWLVREVGPVCAVLGVQNAWEAEGRRVMEEEVLIRVFRAGPQGRAIDVRLTFNALEPLRLSGRETEGRGYGGFLLRLGPRDETFLTTPEGVQTEDSDHQHSPWADASGRFRGADGVAGMAIFQHPDNPGFPTAWTLRHYGLIGPAWPGLDVVSVAPGEPLTLRYRVWVHQGAADDGGVAAAYHAFAAPPAVRPAR